MVQIHLTVNPRTNGHTMVFNEDDAIAVKQWALGLAEFKENKMAIVVERPGREDAHMHALFEGPESICPGRQKSQEAYRWVYGHRQELPSSWKWGTKAVHVKALTGKQTMEMTVAGYLRKEQHTMVHIQGLHEDDLNKAAAVYARKLVCPAETLVETSYMQKALEYRNQNQLESTDLAEVLAHMCNHGYSINYLTRKRKISADEIYLFKKQCNGKLTANDIEVVLFAEPTEAPMDPVLASKMDGVIKSISVKHNGGGTFSSVLGHE